MTAPVSVADNHASQGGQGLKADWCSRMERYVVDAGSSLFLRRFWIQCPTQYGHGADEDEEDKIEEVHYGGEDGEAIELIGEQVHKDSKNACVHSKKEPYWRKILNCVPEG